MDNAPQKKSETMEGLINFRDLGNSSMAAEQRYVKAGMVFRSGTLDRLSSENVDELIESHKIKTILDLRTSLEGKNDLPIDKSFPTMALENIGAMDLIADIPTGKRQRKRSEFDHGRKKYRVNFAGRSFQKNVIWQMCSPWLKLRIIFWTLLRNKRKATYIVGREVLTPMGVPKMYKEFLASCKDEILDALRIFSERQNYPILVHCTQGKDRTGLMCMLLLGIAGAPESSIVNDYAKTQEGLAPVLPAMIQEMAKSGLSEVFATAPPEFMSEVLEFIKEEYGDIPQYLTQIGFGSEWQERVRKIICA
ncbi:hypothetical protein NQZ79_g1101 [Umbelopsis isabellina]|nr:hypothetical protein NQZ79_g1101 [Umbelopsis isabellina]